MTRPAPAILGGGVGGGWWVGGRGDRDSSSSRFLPCMPSRSRFLAPSQTSTSMCRRWTGSCSVRQLRHHFGPPSQHHCQVLKNTPPSPLSHSSYPRSGTPRHFCLPRSSQLNTSVSSTVQSYRTTHPRCVTRPPSLFDLFKLCAHAHWALLAIQSCAQFDPSRSFLSRSLSAGIAYKAPEPTLDSIMDLIDTKCANFDIISDHFCAFPGRAMCTTSCLCVSAAD